MPFRSLRTAAFVLATLALAGCRQDRADAPVPALPEDAPVPPAALTPAHFEQLGWLEGTWRGLEDRPDAFVEDVRMVDDSTFQFVFFSDETLADSMGAASLYYGGGQIRYALGRATWHATSVEDHAAHFAPREGAPHAFSWTMESPDVRTTTIHEDDGATVQRMERISR
jgi:hypothetical protein